MTQNPYQGYPPPPPQGPTPGQYPYPGGQPDPGYGQPPPQGPPGGWAQPAPQGPPPGQYPGYPPAAPQGPPPPGQYGTPPGPPPAPGGGDGFGMPDTRPAAGDQPAIHQLATSNRLVLIRPSRWNVGGTKYNTNEPEEQMVVDMIVCDGPPIPGHTDFVTRVETPFAAGPMVVPFFLGGVIVNKAIKDRCRSALEDPTTPNTVLGRLSSNTPKSGTGFPWWNLEEPTEQDKATAREIFASWDQIKAAAKITAQVPPPAQQGYGQPPPQQYQQAPQGPPPGGYPGYPAQNPYGAPPQQPPWPQNGQPPYPTH